MNLPQDFLDDMKMLLEADEYQKFIKSFDEDRSFGLRYNPLKITQMEFEKNMPYTLSKVAWSKEGYFYDPAQQPGKSVYHEAGTYYIQEPSAMVVVELLDPVPGEKVCDLCAAPGGKSTQIAGKLHEKGLLVSNEIHPVRAKILSQNIERFGVSNAIVLNETTSKMATVFPVFFDKIVVDAPCSGEGMFRKEEAATQHWSRENVNMCQVRQIEILDHAAAMLRPGGTLVYSTCTFAKEEDEDVVNAFLQSHPEFEADQSVLSITWEKAGIRKGNCDGSIRMWPHALQGEGHFAARLFKRGGENTQSIIINDVAKKRKCPDLKKQAEWKLFQEFCDQFLKKEYVESLYGEYVWFGTQLYLLPTNISLRGLKVERAGLHLGEARKNRFEPSHSWAMALKKEQVKQSTQLKDPVKYLRGESDTCENTMKGWTLALVQNISIGWGKAQNGQLKNHYPKGLRKEV